MGHGERFWLEEPRDLFARFDLLPKPEDTFEEKLNAITRLMLILAIVFLVVFNWKHWLTFLLIALVLIIFVYLIKQQTNNSDIEFFDELLSDFTYYKDLPDNHNHTMTSSYIDSHHNLQTTPLDQLYTRMVGPTTSVISEQDSSTNPVSLPETRRSQKKGRTAYDLMRASYIDEDNNDRVDKDRSMLFGSIL